MQAKCSCRVPDPANWTIIHITGRDRVIRCSACRQIWRERASSSDGGGATWFFSSYGGILELRRGIQAASCVAEASPIFHSSCEGKLGIALE